MLRDMSSRHYRVQGNNLGGIDRGNSIQSWIDEYSTTVRTRCTRYRMASITAVSTTALLVWNLPTMIQLLQSQGLHFEMAKVKMYKTLAICAFAFSLGAEDQQLRRTSNKVL